MCSRYSVGKDPVHVAVANDESTFQFDIVFNAAPTQTLPVILLEKGKLTSRNMKWGFIRKSGLCINARSETLDYNFNSALHQRRCLVPANGFYEWEYSSHGKLPWRFCLKTGKSFCFAGLYERRVLDGHKQLELDGMDAPPASCVEERFLIITGNPNPMVNRIHNRMPVIVNVTHYGWWLDESKGCCSVPENCYPRNFGRQIKPAENDMFMMALQTFSEKDMDCYRISQVMNNPRNNTAVCFRAV